MNEEPVRVERQGGVAIVTIDRAGRMNTLSRDTLLSFGKIGAQLVGDATLRAVIVTGAGDKAFCAGADLKERRGMDEAAVREQIKLYRSQLGWIDRFFVPVVAAINGLALGGGLELALMCDLRVAAAHAELGLPETTLGIIPGAGGTQRLPPLIGEAKAKELILLGRRLSAAEALAIGLVNRVTPADKPLLDDVLSYIGPIIEGAPIAQRAALAAIDAARDVPLEHGLELERTFYDECLFSEDRREALAAFAEKRKPRFSGR
jgi:methylglutaconyl-CoA hydratase